MRKITLFIAMAIFCLPSIIGQNSDDSQAVILQLQNRVSELEKEVEYYKQTLNLLNSKTTATDKNVDFKVTVIGERNTGKITVEGILVNNGVTRSVQRDFAQLFDPQGNERNTRDIVLGNGNIRLDELHREVPVRFSVEMGHITPETPILSALTIRLLSNYTSTPLRSDNLSVMFRNIPVEWR
jgi:hypothetical protein